MNPQMIQQLKGLMNQIKMAQNPQLALNQMLMNNPKAQEALNFIKQNGNNPQTAFTLLARQKGVDPAEFLKELTSQ